MKLLHMLPALKPGGPVQALQVLMARSEEFEHTVVSLDAAVRGQDLLALRRQGAKLLRAPEQTQLAEAVAASDVVLVHFYNHPLLIRALGGELPPARWMVWYKVLGRSAPQFFYPRRLGQGVKCLFTAANEAASPEDVIPSMVREAFVGLQREAHEGLVIDYIGSTNMAKLHPQAIEYLAQLRHPQMKIRIHGGPLDACMQHQLAQASNQSSFELGGYSTDVADLLATSDIFVTPMAPGSYASSDIALQEAMHAGLAVAVLGNSGPADMISNGKDGLVSSSGDGFVQAVQSLCDNKALRQRLGDGARASARRRFDPAVNAARMREAIGQRGAQARCHFGFSQAADLPASSLYLMSQGWTEAQAGDAQACWQQGERQALADYATSLSEVAARVEGGLIQWRNAFPEDNVLRWLSASWHASAGDESTARAELAGLDLPGARMPGSLGQAE
ncbi:MAG: glycosyltransferase [Pseudomonadota bacterium]